MVSAVGLPWSREWGLRVVWTFSAIALGLQSSQGADFVRYAEWADAFASSNVFKLGGTVVSPVGVPVSQWSHGPGLVTDAVGRALALLPFSRSGLHVVSWLAAIGFWWAVIGLARRVTGDEPVLVFLTLAVTFIGTHAGFYSTHHSSEIFSLAGLSIAMYWALGAEPRRLRDGLCVGIACGLLLVVRVNLALYVLLPLAAHAAGVWRHPENRAPARLALHAAAVGAPLLAFAGQLLFFNYWMTGSLQQSPYVFGDDGFRSMDPTRPLLSATLFHPWHGLVTYHPIFAPGVVGLFALSSSSKLGQSERLLWAYALFCVLVQLYIHASWWCWWDGLATFGHRTLAIAIVVAVAGLGRWLWLLVVVERFENRAAVFALLGAAAAACLWSLLLFFQGHSNHTDWGRLLRSQRDILSEPAVFFPLAVGVGVSLGVGVIGFRQRRSHAVFLALAGFVVTLAVHGLYYEVLRTSFLGVDLYLLTLLLLALPSLIAFVVVVHFGSAHEVLPARSRLAQTLVAGCLVWVFVFGNWAFAKLAIATDRAIAVGWAKSRPYGYRSTLVIDEMLAGVREYDMVRGFEDRKRSAKRFIDTTAQKSRIVK